MRGKKMKHKIYLQFCLIAALAILITTTIVTALFYQRFKAQVFSDVRTYAYVLTSVDTYDEATLIQEVHQLDNLRVTIIDKEGKVLLDTNADIGGMENHSNREEIKAAFETGEGQAVRQSKTVAKLNRWLKTWIMSTKLRFIRRWNHLLIRFADNMKIF